MKWRSTSMVAALPIVVVACAAYPKEPPFIVRVRGHATSCTIEVEGRPVIADELLMVARREVKPRRRAHIDADMTTTYRCIGGVVYTLQMAGFKDVGFTAEPTAKPQ
jgi:biopolymer transport protein ExbD